MSKKSKKRDEYWVRVLKDNPKVTEGMDFSRPGWKKLFKKKLNEQKTAEYEEANKLALERFQKLMERMIAERKAKETTQEVVNEVPIQEQQQAKEK